MVISVAVAGVISNCSIVILITEDRMHHPYQIARPEWAGVADTDSQKRRALLFLERYADTGTLVFGTHFAAPTAGQVVREEVGLRLEV